MEASLEGRVIAIAGAAGGLGPTVVKRLAGTGARLCLCGRERAALDQVASDAGVQADVDVVDLLDVGATHAWADALVERHGHVEGLVHLVGGYRGGTAIEEAPLEDWEVLAALLVKTA